MSKAMVVKMMVAVAAVALVCGCAGAPKGPSDEDLIKTRVGQFCEGLLAHDLDKTGAAMSDEFYHPEAGDKEAALDFFQQGIDSGYLDDAEFDQESAEIEIDGDTATIYPIELSSAAGSVTIELELTKEDAGWMITMMDIEGI